MRDIRPLAFESIGDTYQVHVPLRSVPAAAAARAGTIGPGPGLVDRQRTALEVLAVQSGDGLVGLFLVRHLDEAETAALARELVLDDGRARDLAFPFGVGHGID